MSSPYINDITLPTKDIQEFSSPKEAREYMRGPGGKVRIGNVVLTEELVAQLQGIGAPTNNVYKNGIYISNDTKTAILATLGLAKDDIWDEWMDDQEDKLAYIEKHMGNPENIQDPSIKKDYQKIFETFLDTLKNVRNKKNGEAINAVGARYQVLFDEIHRLKDRIDESISQDEHAKVTRDQAD